LGSASSDDDDEDDDDDDDSRNSHSSGSITIGGCTYRELATIAEPSQPDAMNNNRPSQPLNPYAQSFIPPLLSSPSINEGFQQQQQQQQIISNSPYSSQQQYSNISNRLSDLHHHQQQMILRAETLRLSQLQAELETMMMMNNNTAIRR
jgi:hypothetical protein